MSDDKLIISIEAALFSSLTPLSPEAIQRLFDENEKPAIGIIRQALNKIETIYANRGVILKEVGSGYRFQVNPEVTPFMSKMHEVKAQRYSRALMETLALIAYRQPITRAEIEEIRGVAVSTHIIKTLMEHHWVRIVGHKEVPGRPGLYATTKHFLDHFDLKSLEELPQLPEIKSIEKMTASVESRLAEESENKVETHNINEFETNNHDDSTDDETQIQTENENQMQ